MLNFITNLDFIILSDIQNYFKRPFLDTTIPLITVLGNSGMIWIIISLILICNKKYRTAGILTLLALIVTALLGEVILKNLVQRSRPFLSMPDIKLLITAPTSYSFPSGHTSSSFTAAAMLSHNFKKYRFGFFTVAILIAFSRLYLCVHFPSDILGGIILGVIGYFITLKLYDFLKNKYLSYNNDCSTR